MAWQPRSGAARRYLAGGIMPATMSAPAPELSVVVPVHNESGNVGPLLSEIERALGNVLAYEAVFVNDGSADDTLATLQLLARKRPWLVVVSHRRNCGQSTALRTGIREARGSVVATLDGDLQNDPTDVPRLLSRWRELREAAPDGPVLVVGWRARRHDTWIRRLSSRIANGVRARVLGDATPDTGCALKVFARDDFLALPYFDHMHRFLPALVKRAGGTVESVVVSHRPRSAGRSHYGIHNRLWVGVVDLLGVMWLQRRARVPEVIRFRD